VSVHPIEEMSAVVIYEHDGALWVRNAVEFDDGRFEKIAAAPPPPEIGKDVARAIKDVATDIADIAIGERLNPDMYATVSAYAANRIEALTAERDEWIRCAEQRRQDRDRAESELAALRSAPTP
jgi:hypothetical protein